MNAPLRRLATVVTLLFATLLVASTWIQVVSAEALADKPGNARTLYKEYGRERGPILVAGTPWRSPSPWTTPTPTCAPTPRAGSTRL